MYSSRDNNKNNNNAYGQPPKPQSYSPSRHGVLLGGHLSAGAHFGSQYTSAYGSSALNSALQVPATSIKGAGPSVLEGRNGYDSTVQDSPKYASRDYPAATQKYGHKGEKLYPDKLNDYPLEDRLPYAERLTSYSGRDLQNEATARFADSIAFGHQRQADIYDRYDAAAVLRKELLLSQSLQPASVDGGPRQADFLSARAATVRHLGQELLPYGGRVDADLQTLSRISGSQHAPSILGAAPGRDVEDLIYSHSSVIPGYGVSLPPGRAYTSGKALHGTSLDLDYPGGILTRDGYARLDDKDDVPFALEVDRREEDLRWEILRERERERARQRDRERQRDQEREHERERERERDRDRERERERRRERERERERRVKEKDRELKRSPEVKLERTPLRSSRDRGRSSSAIAGRSSRRESPLIEASHRRPSPVKEKRREYICKVYSSNLTHIERDYLSMDKRYPRLYVSPECSKVVVNWSRENLNVPFHTPISFEHDFLLEEKSTEHVSASTKAVTDTHAKLETGTTRWNAKMLLMSGLSHNAWEELSSERNYEDRIPHLCNMLRFAFLKDGNASMAIGGSWDTVDGYNPSVDKSALVQTLLRHSKEFTSLDFKNCRHWNPFLEIHYDRVGKDGLFSHKEVTVLYIPDLSDCLPSIDAWRAQWYAHKKAIEEREWLHALKREKLREKEELKEKEAGTTKILKKDEKTVKKKETGSASKVDEKRKAGTKDKAKETGKEEDNTIIEKKAGVETVDEGNSSGKKSQKEVQSPGSGKKIIKKVIKRKVADKNADENAPKQNDTGDLKHVEKAGASTDVIGEGAEQQSATPSTVKTSTAKKVAKESLNESKESECSEDKPKVKEGAGATIKTAIKKEIIKQVAKKKVSSEDANDKTKVAKEKEVGTAIVEETVASGNQESEVKSETNQSVSEQQKVMGGLNEVGNEGGNNQVKEEMKAAKRKIDNEDNNDKSKDGKEKKVKDGKAESMIKGVKDKKKVEEPPRRPGLILQTKGSKSSKLRSLSLSLDSLLDYTDKDIEESTFELSIFAETFYEMLQFQMGSRILMFLQKLRIKFVAKRNQKKRQRGEVSDNKKREKSSSTKKSSPKRQKTEDVSVERKSFENETLQEGSLVDEKTVTKEENMLIDNGDTKPEDESKPEDPEEEPDEDLEEEEPEEDPEEEPEEDPEEEPEEDPEEYPEEIPDEDEVMVDAIPKNNDEKAEAEKVIIDVKSIKVDGKVKDEHKDNVLVTAGVETKSEAENKKGTKTDIKKKEKDTPVTVNVKVKDEQNDNVKITKSMDTKSEAGKKEDTKVIKKKEKETPVSINKELLQAFRFFDRNRVGYIRVEDLRLILHALGNSMSHRVVKELVQSALLESNTGRDDRILYNKLVKMTRV